MTVCEWFVTCTNEAIAYVETPMGNKNICLPCANKMGYGPATDE